MEKISLKRGYIILLIKISLFSCSKFDDQIYYSTNDFGNRNSICNLSLQAEFNDIMELNDYIDLNVYFSLENTLFFDSVHDFYNLLNVNENIFDNYSITESSNSIFETRFRVFYNKSSSLDFEILYKLEDENINQDFMVINLESSFGGISVGRDWIEQLSQTSFFSGNVVIDYHGYLKYNLIINNIGVAYYDYKHYKIVLDIHTGFPISILILDS
ncbi:MAG: hypothetical protein KJO41_08210 [Bacteroidia bacterium]|nr:hypothetical protein [Bacteroidia bacterium]MBT8278971.1 hypothetical protein [Bacteroidia bacterium]NND26489.1 hypothetical protein [Flavobacteriaceae bacterium]NNK60645.1 hypothetical protein [Flavobacteriaceae bacterium]NNL32195.1 hypothetical protein [Flavobacteriaceae bacterium]